MQRAGIIPLLAKLLKSSNENMLIPVGGIIEECATDVGSRLLSPLDSVLIRLDLVGLSCGHSQYGQRSREKSLERQR